MHNIFKSLFLMLPVLPASPDSSEANPVTGSAASTGARFAVVPGHSSEVFSVCDSISVRDQVLEGLRTFFKVLSIEDI